MQTSLDLSAIFKQETFDREARDALKELAFAGRESHNRFLELVAELEQKAESREGDIPRLAMKLGVSYLFLGDTRKATQWLRQAGSGAERSYFFGHSAREEKRYRDAIDSFQQAAADGWDKLECDCLRAECHVLLGELESGRKILDAAFIAGENAAVWHHAEARYWDAAGELNKAMNEYERALEIDPEDPRAAFHLAYLYDLHGDDEHARELYESASDAPYVHLNTLINLAILHEDEAEYEEAADCLKRVLAVNPDHARARLYLKDVLAAGDMFIDEQQMIDSEKRNAILDIPVSDFELSVRSRNCLKKMNINTLGELLSTTEAELLAYKNFGDTSLEEIKVMLSQKGLALGQLAGEKQQSPPVPTPQLPSPEAPDPELADRAVSTIDLSVRARKCLQILDITTIGELLARSESELLASRNFGKTSLEEIKNSLAELGISLRSNGSEAQG